MLTTSRIQQLTARIKQAAAYESRVQPVKHASSLGGEPSTSFETALAQLGLEYVKDKAPKLFEFPFGFQLIDRADDNEKAVGMFAFRLPSGLTVYVPTFFLDGKVKGHEMMWIKELDTKLPLQEKWIATLLARKPHVIGEPVSRNNQSQRIRFPNLTLPYDQGTGGLSKMGEELVRRGWQPWAAAAAPDILKLATTAVLDGINQLRELQKTFNLPTVLRSDPQYCFMLKNAFDKYPRIKDLCDRQYGPNLLRDAVQDLHTREKVAQTRLLWHDMPALSLGRDRQADLEIHVRTNSLEPPHSSLSQPEREVLLKRGYVIRDKRAAEKLSQVFRLEDSPEILANPDRTGIYDVLVEPRNFERHVVIVNPMGREGREHDQTTLVKLDDPHTYDSWSNRRVFIRNDDGAPSNGEEQFSKFPGADTPSSESQVFAVFPIPGGVDAAGPLRVNEAVGERRYRIYFNSSDARTTWPEWTQEKNPSFRTRHRQQSRHDGVYFLQIADSPTARMGWIGDTLVVPQGTKFIPLSYGGHEAVPAAWSRIFAKVANECTPLRVRVRGSEATINNSRPMPKLAAFLSLVRDHSLSEKDAEAVMHEAAAMRPVRIFVKYAQPPALYTGSEVPYFPDPGANVYGGFGAPEQMPETQFLQMPQTQFGPSQQQSIYPSQDPDFPAMQGAMQAGEAGQPELVDTLMVSSLLKRSKPQTMIQPHLSNLMKALDSLGSLLIGFRWHNEEFRDQYGDADLPDLEDALMNAFEVVGDVVHFLREKDVGAMSDVGFAEPDISSATGD